MSGETYTRERVYQVITGNPDMPPSPEEKVDIDQAFMKLSEKDQIVLARVALDLPVSTRFPRENATRLVDDALDHMVTFLNGGNPYGVDTKG